MRSEWCLVSGFEKLSKLDSIHLKQTTFPIWLGNVAFPQEELEVVSQENDIWAALLALRFKLSYKGKL